MPDMKVILIDPLLGLKLKCDVLHFFPKLILSLPMVSTDNPGTHVQVKFFMKSSLTTGHSDLLWL